MTKKNILNILYGIVIVFIFTENINLTINL